MAQIYLPLDDSFLIEKCILGFDLTGKSCLDLGCGSGILSVAMLKAGARNVVALDVNKNAVIETKKNVENFIRKNEAHYVGHFLGAFESDLFSILGQRKIDSKISVHNFLTMKKFDFISFNPPYVPTDGIKWVDLDGGKDGSEVILRFISSVKNHLNKRGIVFLLISSLNKKSKIIKLIKSQGFKVQVLDKKKLFFEELIVLKLVLFSD